MSSSLAQMGLRQSAKLAVLAAMKTAGVFQIARRAQRTKLRILAYHGAWEVDDGFSGDAMFIRPETFRRRLRLLERWGYRVVSLDEGLRLSSNGSAQDVVVITIDDGWSTVASHLWPALQARSCPATLYVDTANLLAQEPVYRVVARYLERLARQGRLRMQGGRPRPARDALQQVEGLLDKAKDRHCPNPRELLGTWAAALHIDLQHYLQRETFQYVSEQSLRAMNDSGLDVQLHTHHHTLGDFERETVHEEISVNRRVLSDICAVPPETFRHFCYPSGRHSVKAEPVLEALGIRSGVLTAPGLACVRVNSYALPRILDGDHMSDLEFEAELCGLLPWVRDVHCRNLPSAQLSQPADVA